MLAEVVVKPHAAERYLERFCGELGKHSKGRIRWATEHIENLFLEGRAGKTKYVRPIPYVSTEVYRCNVDTHTGEMIWLMVDDGVVYTVMTDFGFVSRYVLKDGRRVFAGDSHSVIKLDKPKRSGIDIRCGKRRRG